MSVEKLGEENVCDGCPAVKAFDAQIEWAELISCRADRESYRQSYVNKKRNLVEMAGVVACSKTAEELNKIESDIPPLGQEWYDYVSQCGVFTAQQSEK